MDPNQQQNPFNTPPTDGVFPQPEPQMQNNQPQNPFDNPQMTPMPVSPLAPQKKSKKGLIIGLAAGGGALLIGLIVMLILVLGGGISNQDYRDAHAKATTMASNYNSISTVYLSAYSTETELKNGVEKINKNIGAFNATLKELGEMKAIKNDKEAANLYKALTDKKSKFDAAMVTSVESYEKLLPAFTGMSSSSTSAVERAKAMQDSLDSISGLQSQLNKDLVSKLKTIAEKMVPVAQRVQAGRDDYTKYDSKASTEFYDLTSDWTSALTDWQSDLEKVADEAEIKDEINAIGEYLTTKVNGTN